MKKLNQTKPVEAVECDFSKAFLGLFIVILGLAFLVNNLGIIVLNVNFLMVFPLLIIFIGLTFFSKKNVVSTVLGSIVAAISVSLVFIFFIVHPIVSYGAVSVFPISVSKDLAVEKANISLNVGAGEVMVYGINTENLVEGELKTNLMAASVNSKTENGVQDVEIGIKEGRKWMHSGNFKNEFAVGIDKNIDVVLSINSGASNNNIDLTNIKVESVTVHTGASNVNLKMGDILNNSNVVIEAGASSINLSLPRTVGVKLFVESGLSSQELPNLISTDKNTYQSLNYESSLKKINISVKMGMASLYINWYEPEKREKVSLFYYNQSQDKENSCDYEFVVPVEREILSGQDIIKNTVELLIRGQLTEKEKSEGFTTEFPNADFKLLESNLSEKGKLTLKFTEVPRFTSGGSCRVGLLMEEVLKTAKQFPQVKSIVLEPESLFEP
jgi:hypothetical protein